jgi:hypothetical protein
MYSPYFLLKTIIFIWVATEAMSLAYLYSYGYHRHKPSPVIKSLYWIFLSVSIFFTLLSFMPILSYYTDGVVTDEVVFSRNILAVFAIPIAFSLAMFRKESLKKQNKIVI